MTERLSENRHEHSKDSEPSLQERAKLQESIKEKIESEAKRSRHEHADKIGEIRSKIEEATKKDREQGSHSKEHEKAEDEQPALISRELKDLAYRRNLRRTQAKLPAPARAFSRMVHNPVVDAISETAGKTVARPSGVLAGGIFAFLGSSIFLWVTRHYGYEYNYLLLTLFFVGGFFVGLLVEIMVRLFAQRD